MNRFFLNISLIICLSPALVVSAQVKNLNLEQVISLACDSSLSAFSAKNTYLSNYWAYRSFKAARLPSLSISMTPLEYERTFTSRYNSETNRDEYRQQQSLFSYGNLSVQQNVDITGGTLYMDSELGYVKDLGSSNYQQFSAVPIRFGYSQRLIGYNNFKWEKKIEPLKYEKARRKLLYMMEEISESAVQYFFSLAMAQVNHDLAKASLASSDTLYRIGKDRQQIASISQADLLTLKLDMINAGNALSNADISLKKATFSLAAYLNLDKKSVLRLELPERPKDFVISAEKALELVRENNPDFLANRQAILEAKQAVEKTTRSSKMEASLNMSLGFNQVASGFRESYRDPIEQDVVSLSLNIPLVDWGVRKGKVNMAKNQLSVTELAVKQDELSLEEEITMTVNDFNLQQNLIRSAEEAQKLADMAYEATKERYLINKADISSLTLALNRQENSRKNYISALQNYWLSYYKIRKLTLFDFATGQSLSTEFESKYGIH